MVHGLIEGRICHYVTKEGEHLAAEIVKVLVNDRHQSRANLHVKSPDSAEIIFAADVMFMPPAKNVPNSFHWVERAD